MGWHPYELLYPPVLVIYACLVIIIVVAAAGPFLCPTWLLQSLLNKHIAIECLRHCIINSYTL
jgi:hypothetical protein